MKEKGGFHRTGFVKRSYERRQRLAENLMKGLVLTLEVFNLRGMPQKFWLSSYSLH
jgi:hypothetical protein